MIPNKNLCCLDSLDIVSFGYSTPTNYRRYKWDREIIFSIAMLYKLCYYFSSLIVKYPPMFEKLCTFFSYFNQKVFILLFFKWFFGYYGLITSLKKIFLRVKGCVRVERKNSVAIIITLVAFNSKTLFCRWGCLKLYYLILKLYLFMIE